MFTVIARNAETVTIVDLDTTPHQMVTLSVAEYRTLGVTVSEFVPQDTVYFIGTGSFVPVRAKAAKSHDFQGGWNGYSFYLDSKGVLYAVKNAPRTYSISLERQLSE